MSSPMSRSGSIIRCHLSDDTSIVIDFTVAALHVATLKCGGLYGMRLYLVHGGARDLSFFFLIFFFSIYYF